ncbi:MAG: hypothetical protein ACRD5K_19815 [Candidatus Acidiferrales bacterium]
MTPTNAKGRAEGRSSSTPDSTNTNQKFSRVVRSISRDPKVTLGGSRGFGSGALKVNGKIFAMLSSRGQFVVKLPKLRVDGLIASAKGERFEPRPGQPMKEWIVLPQEGVNWVELAKEACEFVKRTA